MTDRLADRTRRGLALTAVLLALALPACGARAQVAAPAGGQPEGAAAAQPGAPAAPARSWVWCGARGGATTGYVGDITPHQHFTKFRLSSLSSRFLRVVNSTYGERIETSGGICRGFTSAGRAESMLSSFKLQMQGEGRTVTVIGVF